MQVFAYIVGNEAFSDCIFIADKVCIIIQDLSFQQWHTVPFRINIFNSFHMFIYYGSFTIVPPRSPVIIDPLHLPADCGVPRQTIAGRHGPPRASAYFVRGGLSATGSRHTSRLSARVLRICQNPRCAYGI